MSTINPRKVVLQVLSDLPGEDVTTPLSSIEGRLKDTASAAEVALILVVFATNRNSFVAGGAKSYFALTTFGMALMTMATCAVN